MRIILCSFFGFEFKIKPLKIDTARTVIKIWLQEQIKEPKKSIWSDLLVNRNATADLCKMETQQATHRNCENDTAVTTIKIKSRACYQLPLPLLSSLLQYKNGREMFIPITQIFHECHSVMKILAPAKINLTKSILYRTRKSFRGAAKNCGRQSRTLDTEHPRRRLSCALTSQPTFDFLRPSVRKWVIGLTSYTFLDWPEERYIATASLHTTDLQLQRIYNRCIQINWQCTRISAGESI